MYRFYIKEQNKKRMMEYPKKEVIQLAELIGIDFESEPQYRWFLNQALTCVLPVGWKRESDPLGNVHYHNVNTQVTTKNNPLIYKFRQAFERIVQKENETNYSEAAKVGGEMNKAQQEMSMPSIDEQQSIFEKLMGKALKSEAKAEEGLRQAFKEAEEFYDTLFMGSDLKPPSSILESFEYQLVNPEDMITAARNYNIPLDYSFMWIARVCVVLPMPPLWRVEFDVLKSKVFINSEFNIKQAEPPYLTFLVKYLQKAKANPNPNVEKIMTFYDRDHIKYVVDLVKLCSREDYIIQKDPTPDPEFKKKALSYKPHLTSEEALTDIMIYEIAQTSGIDFNREMHLISAVYQIIETMKNEGLLKNWELRLTMEGNKYWYNTKEKRSLNNFPFKDDVKKYVRSVRKGALDEAKNTIKGFQDRHGEFLEKGKEFYELCHKEALVVSEAFVKKLQMVLDI